MEHHKKHKEILDFIHDTYIRKNQDYGNSFEEQMDKRGHVAGIIRLEDKLRRIDQLTTNEAKVKDESLSDTLIDLANYAIMYAMWLQKKTGKITIPQWPDLKAESDYEFEMPKKKKIDLDKL
jgi:hypothetical protein